MKKGSLLVLIVLIAALQVHAEEYLHLTTYKTEYAPAETIQVDIIFDNPPLKDMKEQNILLVQQGLKVAIAPFVEKVNQNKYIAYFTLPLTIQEGTYELQVEKVDMIVDKVLQEISQSTPVVIKKQPPYLSISPGVIILDAQKEIKVTFTNKGQSTSVTIVTPPFLAHVYQGPQLINQGTSRTFKFTVNGTIPSDQEQIMKVTYEKEYKIPIISLASALPSPPPQETPLSSQNPFIFVAPTSSLERTIDEQKTLKGTIALKNLKNETLQGVSLTLIGDLYPLVTLSPSGFDLQPSDQQNITITVNEKKNAPEEKYDGSLVATYQGFSLPYEMIFSIMHAPIINITTKNETTTQPPTQNELDDFFNYTVPPSVTTPKRSYALWALIIALALGVIFSYLLRKQTVKKQTFEEYMKKVQKK